jgi:hypothetical protein
VILVHHSSESVVITITAATIAGCATGISQEELVHAVLHLLLVDRPGPRVKGVDAGRWLETLCCGGVVDFPVWAGGQRGNRHIAGLFV